MSFRNPDGRLVRAAFISAGGSKRTVDSLDDIGYTSFNSVKYASDSAASFVADSMSRLAHHQCPTPPATDEPALAKLYERASALAGASSQFAGTSGLLGPQAPSIVATFQRPSS